MAKKRKKQVFSATKAVKSAARELLGMPTPTKVVPDAKTKAARRMKKHKPDSARAAGRRRKPLSEGALFSSRRQDGDVRRHGLIAPIPEADSHVVIDAVGHGERDGQSQQRMHDADRPQVAVTRKYRGEQQSSDECADREHGIGEMRAGKYQGGVDDCPAGAKHLLEIQEEERLQDELLLERPQAIGISVPEVKMVPRNVQLRQCCAQSKARRRPRRTPSAGTKWSGEILRRAGQVRPLSGAAGAYSSQSTMRIAKSAPAERVHNSTGRPQSADTPRPRSAPKTDCLIGRKKQELLLIGESLRFQHARSWKPSMRPDEKEHPSFAGYSEGSLRFHQPAGSRAVPTAPQRKCRSFGSNLRRFRPDHRDPCNHAACRGSRSARRRRPILKRVF